MKTLLKKFIVFFILICQLACQDDSLTTNQLQIRSLYQELYESKYQLNTTDEQAFTNINLLATKENVYFKTVATTAKLFYYQKKGDELLVMRSAVGVEQALQDKPNDTLLYHALLAKGNYYKNSGDYTTALGYYLKSKKIAVVLKDIIKLSGVYANMGQLYYQKNDFKKAVFYSEKVRTMLQKAKMNPPYLLASHTLANIAGMQGRFKEALAIDKEGIALTTAMNADVLKVMFLDNQANCFLFSNRLEAAEHTFKRCLSIDLKVGHKKQISDSYSNLSALYALQGEELLMLDYYHKSLSLIKQINYKPGLLKNYSTLQDFYKKNGHYQKSLEFSNQYMSVYKELMNEKRETAQAISQELYQNELNSRFLLEEQVRNQKITLWFGLLCILLLSIGIYFYLQYKKQHTRNRYEQALNEERLKIELNEQKLEISRELHDNIGAQLTFINGLVDSLQKASPSIEGTSRKKLQTISEFTSRTITDLRDTIWVLNPAHLNADELASRMYNFIKKAQEATEVVNFKTEISLESDFIFSTKYAITVLRLFQEIINNAVKHSRADLVTIEVTSTIKSTTICISDNGVGFDLETVSKSGLLNLQNRVIEFDGSLNIVSEINKGTKITINLPI